MLACGWVWAGCMRLRETRRLQQSKLQTISTQLAARHGVSASKANIAVHTNQPLPDADSKAGAAATILHAVACSLSRTLWASVMVTHHYQLLPQILQNHVLQACLPGVKVVLPIQGQRTHSTLNWQSQLSMKYAGPVEFVFVTQSSSGVHCPSSTSGAELVIIHERGHLQ